LVRSAIHGLFVNNPIAYPKLPASASGQQVQTTTDRGFGRLLPDDSAGSN
jgi:hypothetical protein